MQDDGIRPTAKAQPLLVDGSSVSGTSDVDDQSIAVALTLS